MVDRHTIPPPVLEEEELSEVDNTSLKDLQLPGENEEKTESNGTEEPLEEMEVIVNEDEAYDTDLDENDSKSKSYKSVTATDLYLKACEQLGVVPVTYFLEHMNDEIIIMNHRGLGPNGAKAIAAPLVVNTTLAELDLEDNWITADGMKEIAEMLVENCYITNINLAGNKLKSPGAKRVCSMIRENTNLRELDLSRNDFIDSDGKFFANSLKNNYRLKSLNLSGNAFCEIGGEWMGQAIANNEAIENLNLSWNHLRRKGALAVCAGMKVNINIKFLDLSWNGFADDGAMAMGLALKTNNTLIWLDLSYNRISDKGAAMLAKGLEVNDTLKTLRIGNNPIGNAGSMALIRAIAKNKNSAIEDLDVKGVQVYEDFLIAAQNLKKKVVESSSSKTDFFIHINPVDISASNRKKFSSVFADQDPMGVIQKFLEDKRLRLVDLFRNFDKDLSWKISQFEFKKGILDAGVPLTKQQLKKLMGSLDIDKDGQVNYREFFDGKKKAILRRREMMRQKAEEKKKKKEDGKRMWSAWQDALRITSTSTNETETIERSRRSKLINRSLLLEKQPPVHSKSGVETQQPNKTTLAPITPRLTKSFYETANAKKTEIPACKINLTPRSPTFTTSQTSLGDIGKNESENHFEISLEIPNSFSPRSAEGNKSFASTGDVTPRKSGGIPNSRRKPPNTRK